MTAHARQRALERYGLDVNDDDFRSISEQVTCGRAIKLGRQGSATSVYLVTVQGKDAVVVYRRQSKCVITFLPLTWERR